MRGRRPRLFLKGHTSRVRRRLLAVFLLLFAPPAHRALRADCVPFGTAPAISTTSDFANDVVAADVDGDGDLDVVASSKNDDELAWYENAGSGTGWSRHLISTALLDFTSVDAADIDGDGDSDVAFSGLSTSFIGWIRNDAGGTSWKLFTLSQSADGARQARVHDLDGDGDVDIVGAETFDKNFIFYINGGDGSFTSRLIGSSAYGANATYPADLDGDGDVDLLATAYSAPTSAVLWYRNNDGVGGTWSRLTVQSAAGYAFAVVAADLDRDGDLDAVSASGSNGRIAWHRNSGTGSVWTLQTISQVAIDGFDLATADLDGDGDLDVAAVDNEGALALWFENDGAGGGWTSHVMATGLSGARAMALADLDLDGDADPIVAASNDDAVRWFPNRRLHGAPLFGVASSVATLDAPRQLASGDFDRDGDLDLAVAAQLDDTVALLFNLGDGAEWMVVTVSSTVLGPLSVTAGDVDGDGDLDLLTASRDDDTIAWYELDGEPPADPIYPQHVISTLADVARQVVAADLDGDGDLDAVSASRNDDTIAWYENDGTPLSGSWTKRNIFTAANGAFSVATGDIDGDGDLDVASTSYYDDSIRWHRNDGSPADGGWTSVLVSTAAIDPRFVTVADIDRDGQLDLATASAGDETIRLFRNSLGLGTTWFVDQVSTVATDVYSVRAADVDGDGDLDLVAAMFGSDTVAWYENDPIDTGWTPHTVSVAGNGPTAVAVADLDGDGSLDVAFGSVNDDLVRVAKNPGTLVFAEGQETNEATACWSSAVP